MKKIIFLLLIYLVPIVAFADSENYEDYVETTKYFKTIYINKTSKYIAMSDNLLNSYSQEISKEEYDKYDPNKVNNTFDVRDGVVETDYKMMTTSIKKITNTTFRYTVNLNWKTMPSTRSYDIIGIGFPASVKATSILVFEQKYCVTSGTCKKTNTYTAYKGTNGVGALFSLPTDNIKSMSQTLSVDVVKLNDSVTILKQNAYGDYSHAQKNISYSNAKNYFVDTGGIILDSSIDNFYDHINTAVALWTGRW